MSSRLGVSASAASVSPGQNLFEFGQARVNGQARLNGSDVSHFVCDESQFFSCSQVDQLAAVVDLLGVSVFAFGLMTTFQGELFDGSRRLVELSDRIIAVDTLDLCSCGEVACMNARFVDGTQVKEGEINVVGDILPGEVSYSSVCRRCWMGY